MKNVTDIKRRTEKRHRRKTLRNGIAKPPGGRGALLWMLPLLVAALGCKSKPASQGPEQAPVISSKTVTESKAVDPQYPRFKIYPDARAALSDIVLRTHPTVLGFGEFHQNNGTVATVSALERFRSELLPVLAPSASDLIVETWVPKGCGKVEEKVIVDVEKVTERPPETENETVRLIREAQQLGVTPHILDVQCGQYEALFDSSGEMDYLAMLELVGKLLGDKGEQVLSYRESTALPGRPRVLLYGGALHNDLLFAEEWAGCTFGPRLQKLTAKYVAIDLFVPEFIADSPLVSGESWYKLFTENRSPEHVILIDKAPDSLIIIFRDGVRASH